MSIDWSCNTQQHIHMCMGYTSYIYTCAWGYTLKQHRAFHQHSYLTTCLYEDKQLHLVSLNWDVMGTMHTAVTHGNT